MPDFGFFSWPEPGVSSYLEVRQQTLDREREIALGIRQLLKRGADESIETSIAADNEEDNVEDEGAIGPDSWSKKIPKLIWRGVPMVEVRHVSPCSCPPPAPSSHTVCNRNYFAHRRVSPGPM
jgi:hypothetical protein